MLNNHIEKYKRKATAMAKKVNTKSNGSSNLLGESANNDLIGTVIDYLLFYILDDQIQELEEELSEVQKNYKELSLRYKKDIKELQDKNTYLNNELNKANRKNDILEKRSSKAILGTESFRLNLSPTLRNQNNDEADSYFNENSNHNKIQKALSMNPAKSPIYNASLNQFSERGSDLNNIKIIESNLDDVESDLNINDDDISSPTYSIKKEDKSIPRNVS